MPEPKIVVWCDNSIPAKQLIKLIEKKGWSYKHMFTTGNPCVIVDGIHISGYDRIFSLLS